MTKEKSLHFLVVEDEVEIADVVCLFLGGHFSASFTVAANGEQAVELLKDKTHRYQMIISDYNMPHGNGGYVFNYIKEHCPETPFMLVTSDAWNDHKEFHGFSNVGYVIKPFADETLVMEADRLIKACELEVHQEHHYVGISLQTLANIRLVKHPLFIKLNDEKYIRFLNAGMEITEAEIEKYRQKGITHLFVERSHFSDFISQFKQKVLNQMLFKGLQVPAHESLELSAAVHEVILGAVKALGISAEAEELALKNIDMVKRVTQSFPELSSIFQWAQWTQQDYAFTHSILICYLTTEVAQHLHLNTPYASETLAMAAYFHDLGLENHQIKNESRFIKALLMKSKMNKEDLTEVKEHPLRATEKVKGWKLCPEEVVTIIREHHERPDGSGFPEQKTWETINELSAVFIVCEDFVQSYLEHKDRGAVEKYFKSQARIYSQGVFLKVHQYLMQKLINAGVRSSLAS